MILKKWGKCLLMLILSCAFLLGAMDASAEASQNFFATYKARLAKPVKTNPRILMIGNSHTYYNRMPSMLKKICRAGGINAHIESYAIHGHTLRQWANPRGLSRSEKAKTQKLYKALKNKKWDYIVLQGNTKEMFKGGTAVTKAVGKLLSMAKSKKARVVFYQTWAPEEGHAEYRASYAAGTDVSGYQKKIITNYNKLAKKYKGAVAPAGIAMRRAESILPEISFYNSDKRHASKEGSYLAACVLYSTMFRKTARGKMASSTTPMGSEKREALSKELQKLAADVTLRSDVPNQAGIEMKNTEYVMEQGRKKTLSCRITRKAKYTRISSWISDNKRVAAVSDSGTVTAREPGTARITAILNNGKRASCKITVKSSGSEFTAK